MIWIAIIIAGGFLAAVLYIGAAAIVHAGNRSVEGERDE